MERTSSCCLAIVDILVSKVACSSDKSLHRTSRSEISASENVNFKLQVYIFSKTINNLRH